MKVTKSRFKQYFYDMMAELAADEEGLVQIEGIDIMTEYLEVLKKPLIEKDFLPPLEKVLKKSQDAAIDDEIRTRMARISGKTIDKLSMF